MKSFYSFLFTIVSYTSIAQPINQYFERIRNNTAELTAFFSQMPKGGDLHNHYSGSVYAETYIRYVVRKNYVINKSTLEVTAVMPSGGTNCSYFADLGKNKTLDGYRQKLIQKWSVKDYNGVSYPCDKLFFEAFGGFNIANEGSDRLDTGILELKGRAIKEHVSYLEVMFSSMKCESLKSLDSKYIGQLEAVQANHDEKALSVILDNLFRYFEEKKIGDCAVAFNKSIADMHSRLKIDERDQSFTLRYMNYVSRAADPASLFKNLVLAFESAEKSPLVVGVNIVAPEDGEVSMRDYWLHMQMFRYCHSKYPVVKYSMHAGELTLGLVKPEELTWHINEAVRTAGANRIGHGVDLAYEQKPFELLNYMARKHVAIEINLYSNEFILKVKGDEHPFKLYHDFNVPIVICTDDAGILRSNLIHQYVLLAKRYKFVTYDEIKRYVYNSIEYSFIKEERLKNELKAGLESQFRRFEKEVLAGQPE
jgi:adenosine deaminase